MRSIQVVPLPPGRVDVKSRNLPSGDQRGLLLSVLGDVKRTGSPPARWNDPHFAVILVLVLVDRLHRERDASAVGRDRGSAQRRELVPVRQRKGALGRLLSRERERSGEGGDSRQRPSHAVDSVWMGVAGTHEDNSVVWEASH